jgi:peptidyl-prolyl cis-trans isomerase A (cyclophilin A)
MRLALIYLALAACDAGVSPAPPPKPAPPLERTVRSPAAKDLAVYMQDIPGDGLPSAKITTSEGTIHCDLFPDKAPVAVANFVGLATGKKAWRNTHTNEVETGKPFYTGLTFHRVIPSFMIQGGDPNGRGTGGPGYTFDNELTDKRIPPGALAMANSGDKADGHGTNGSQFFVMEGEGPELGQYNTVFGQCYESDVVRKIARVPRDKSDRPESPVTIRSIVIHRQDSRLRSGQ